jgi:hypothetical protein
MADHGRAPPRPLELRWRELRTPQVRCHLRRTHKNIGSILSKC